MIDVLRSAWVRRESYVRPWLPEQLVRGRGPDPADQVALDGSAATLRLPNSYRPRSPIGLPSGSVSTHTRASGATWRGALRSLAPAASRVSRLASRSSTSA